MGHARRAVQMLTDATREQANEIAGYLEQQNRARQEVEKKILEQAIEQALELKCDGENVRARLVAAHEVAAEVVERIGHEGARRRVVSLHTRLERGLEGT